MGIIAVKECSSTQVSTSITLRKVRISLKRQVHSRLFDLAKKKAKKKRPLRIKITLFWPDRMTALLGGNYYPPADYWRTKKHRERKKRRWLID